MTFEPIAIVGQGCLLPGCRTPDELWRAVAEKRVLLGGVPDGRWRLDREAFLRAEPGDHSAAPVRSDVGGYVTTPEAELALDGWGLDGALLRQLDPVFQWAVHAAGQAWRDAAGEGRGVAPERVGAIMGNLSYPTRTYARWHEHAVLGALLPDAAPHPLNRFMSGLPATVVARALGLGGPAFCLDAACASALYAIKLACDRLQSGECDAMLAGAVNASDNLFIHAGFATIRALSPTGRSRPLAADADGLVPSEGAAFVVLKRLADAVRDGNRVLGTIRGIGLSNDGRSAGFLAPAADGQERAMRTAFAQAGDVSPADVTLLECHATGTAAGDRVEVESTRRVCGARADLCVSALKANLGHSITTSAAAGLLKLLGCLKHGVLPPTPLAGEALPELAAAKYRLLAAPETWPEQKRPRRAAISAFGMGGNNAHLLLEEWRPRCVTRSRVAAPPTAPGGEIAVVALAVRTDAVEDVGEFARALIAGRPLAARTAPETATVALDPKWLFSPPNDLRHALGQQLLMLAVAEEALAGVAVAVERAGVFVGMGADPEINRHALRARLGTLLRERLATAPAGWLERARAAIAETMQPPDIVGTMPNIPANRLNHRFALQGPGFTVSGEEASGDVALELGIAALRRGEIDAALVGAVELGREACHTAAVAAAGGAENVRAADAAVALVLKRAADARAAGEPILALVAPAAGADADAALARLVEETFGSAHAADGLLRVAAAVVAAQHAAHPGGAAGLRPALRERAEFAVQVGTTPLLRERATTGFVVRRAEGETTAANAALPAVFAFAAGDEAALIAQIETGPGGAGGCRLAWVAADEAEARARQTAALAWLRAGRKTPAPAGIYFFAAPVGGELALAFTGAAAAYPGMGRELLVGMPDLVDGLAAVLREPARAAEWIFEPDGPQRSDPFLQLAGCSFLSQAHARLTLGTMGLQPAAALGLSSGETNALFALGIWRDMDGLLEELQATELYRTHLAGRFESVRAHWGELAGTAVEWENWSVRAAPERVKEALRDETRCHLTIVTSPTQCAIGGDRAACRRVLARLEGAPAAPLGHELAVHCPAVQPFEATWRRIHTRPTTDRGDVRVYSNALRGVYAPTRESVATALTAQALDTIDLPRIVDLAWRDGVRVFVEHGPRNHLTAAIGEILGERPHLAVALDVPGRSSLRQAAEVAAQLWTAGVAVELARWQSRGAAWLEAKPARLHFHLRRPPVTLPPLEAVRVLRAAPTLAPVRELDALTTAGGAESSEREDVASLAALHAHLLATHREFLTHQAVAQERWLAYQRIFHAVLAHGGGGGDGGSVPTAEPREAMAPRPPATDLWALPAREAPSGPQWSRAQLETLASGKISNVFGLLFAQQDGYAVQVRMPEPPLLLCDRVTGIAGEPGTMGRGVVWTETDVREDSWYLHHGRMPAGIFIEAGQADLLLISWLGADFLNRGERAYRLLGCELVFRGELPRAGETLQYQIHVDGHARQGDVRLFFFHYDCWVSGVGRISVRHGQAGFFTREELARSGGVIWTAEDADYTEPARIEVPADACVKGAFAATDVAAFVAGDLAACFGEGFAAGAWHTRTPTIQASLGNLIGEIAEFAPRGGPAGRGYLKAVRRLAPDDWFFRGHFKNDPCMPGTLMAEGCLQAMSFYLAALGFTRERDGWRFEPVTDTNYTFVCRGQATPESRELVYELFVDTLAVIDGRPTLFAHVLCTVDGLKAFKCERLGLRLVPDYPLAPGAGEAEAAADTRPVARIGELRLDYASLLACAQGDPVNAFGPTFEPFRRAGRTPRLPSPPYHFCTRVTQVEGELGAMRAGGSVEMLYDIPADAWYFAENGQRTMPFCVLLEVALQPCGWLASYTLDPDCASWRPSYRNLDGVSRQTRDVRPEDGTLTTRVRLTGFTKAGEQIIVRFEVTTRAGDETIFACTTAFGFFTPASLADTKGAPATAEEVAQFQRPANRAVRLAEAREAYRARHGFALPGPRLLRLDRLCVVEPRGGRNGLGYARGEKDVRRDDWVFKAHFYQDPVQPGSIGVESLLLLLKLFALETEPRPAGAEAFFEAWCGGEVEWRYRGQVLTHHRVASADLEVLERVAEPDGATLIAEGHLWVDGKKIYHLPRMGVRLRWRAAVEDAQIIRAAPASFAGFRPIDVPALRRTFRERIGTRGAVLQDLLLGALAQFVDGIEFAEAGVAAQFPDRPVLYLANHQVGIESMLFITLAEALGGVPCRAIAKREHRGSWMGALNALVEEHIGRQSLLLFDRADRADLLRLLGTFAGPDNRPAASLLAHVHGTRALRAGESVTQVSSVLLDLAVRCDMPVVPVRFAGGLPRQPVAQRLEVPVGFARQRYHVGAAIEPAALAALRLRERKELVCAAINELGEPLANEQPGAADAAFAARVAAVERTLGVKPVAACLIACLQGVPEPAEETRALLALLANPTAAGAAAQSGGPARGLLRALGLG